MKRPRSPKAGAVARATTAGARRGGPEPVTGGHRAIDGVVPKKDEALFNALRERRKLLAAEKGVPAYVIFNDATLREMAIDRPRDGTEMLLVSGVGPKKMENFGEAFLEVLRAYK